ncbi:hypothetical protein G6O67_006971 [Ophiocordyceps sinensis]|uniref:EF-hand domain-containing protein n=3 Tax=Ophiocordyceps sinensis TaxID=72228 RepID=A0A8H4PHU6_9HYPO|nr:peflin [Ophiocordyceps sinensis CO18]KAF4504967.1 hypothetical protein G6O67_006971 [Ophiocordyceps sinensis]
MAYNRPYNPDALPRFAEPDAKPGPASPTGSSSNPHSRYESKPPPPVPRPHSQAASQGGRPQHHSRLPPSPVPDSNPGSDSTLLPLFRAVDKDRGGQLSERELSAALVNGDWTAFDIQTVRMMIRMFDSDRNGTINFDEFCGLWSFLASWRTLFDRFDVDHSGNISLAEFTNALIAFRYRLSPQFVELLFRTYDKRNEGVMSFDLFVQSCISLKRMTDVFKKYDDDRDGYITLSFEDFLSEILKQLK